MLHARILGLAMLLLAVCVAGPPLPAQDKDKKDPQSTFEPRSKPGIGQQFLEKFVGDWTVVKTIFPASGAPVRQEGECKQTMTQEGRFLQSDFTFKQGDAKTTGMGLIGFEPETGQFTSVWVDSRQTKMSLRQSKDKFDGEEIVLYSKSLKESGKERVSRTVTRLEDDGRKIVHRQYNVGADGKDRLFMELVLTRKDKAAPPSK